MNRALIVSTKIPVYGNLLPQEAWAIAHRELIETLDRGGTNFQRQLALAAAVSHISTKMLTRRLAPYRWRDSNLIVAHRNE